MLFGRGKHQQGYRDGLRDAADLILTVLKGDHDPKAANAVLKVMLMDMLASSILRKQTPKQIRSFFTHDETIKAYIKEYEQYCEPDTTDRT